MKRRLENPEAPLLHRLLRTRGNTIDPFNIDPEHLRNYVPDYVVVNKNNMRSFLGRRFTLHHARRFHHMEKTKRSLLELLSLSSELFADTDIVGLTCGDARSSFASFSTLEELEDTQKLYIFYAHLNEYLMYVSPLEDGWRDQKDVDEFIDSGTWYNIAPNAKRVLLASQHYYKNYEIRLGYMNLVPLGFALVEDGLHSDIEDSHTLYINDFCSQFRLGRNMMRFVINDAITNGFTKIKLTPWENRPDLVNFYLSLGFMRQRFGSPSMELDLPALFEPLRRRHHDYPSGMYVYASDESSEDSENLNPNN